ncbi:hypothetical protein [Legionella spiritensis]|uniref:Transmembrane protein n=1 Tax=Legionella spiritensis TaxID=452 RepID=A0A0W0YX07_LEGSP|nr:hypothetical protein [Legionella spiritensis]KTD61107.1 hypothetical protein Lspi_2727 [Legionella spiritensis]SNV44940.1 Uncharacterised protein [Legionella spiritensis]
MDDISNFRGMSGEVVRGFLKFSTFLTIIPIVLFWLAFYILLYFIGRRMPGYLFFFLNIAAASFLLARFAIPASQGELNAGIFNAHIQRGETLAFVLRYLIYTLFWCVPVFLILYFVFHTSSLFSLFSWGGTSYLGMGIKGLLMALVMLVCLFAPTIACLLATETSSLEEVFSLDTIGWLYNERRWDLSSFYSSIIGGMLVFYAKYLVPLLVVNLIAYKISDEAGMSFSLFIYLLPVLVSPILIGRLSGAFIAGESQMDSTLHGAINPMNNPVFSSHVPLRQHEKPVSQAGSSIPPASNFVSPARFKKEYEHVMNTLDKLGDEELGQVIETAESTEVNVYTLLQLSYLYKKANRIPEAIEKAGMALQACLAEGMWFEAVQLFKSFAKERAQLDLSPAQLLLLAPHLGKQKLFMHAAWCYLIAINAMEDDDEKLAIQKKFLSLAHDASQQNQLEVALKLYHLFIQNYPDSTLIDFVNTAMSNVQERLDKPSS